MFKQLALVALTIVSINAVDVDPYNLPYQSDPARGQTGINQCTKTYGASSQNSMCQNVFINSVNDFCLWGPAKPNSVIGDVEAEVVSYCIQSGYGTRQVPQGTIYGAHYLRTPSFVQITGTGDLSRINIRAGDEGGELDPHGANGSGNPVGGLVFTTAFSPNKNTYKQIKEWNSFISYNEFCLRACVGEYAHQWCPNIYENNPSNYNPGVFEDCSGTEGEWPGVYHGSTWYQGVSPTPGPQAPGKSSDCTTYTNLGYGQPAKNPLGRRSFQQRLVPRATIMPRAPAFDDMD